jgi:hypothetical protein
MRGDTLLGGKRVHLDTLIVSALLVLVVTSAAVALFRC